MSPVGVRTPCAPDGAGLNPVDSTPSAVARNSQTANPFDGKKESLGMVGTIDAAAATGAANVPD
ncbi:MAG: hypothetical protein KGS10_12515, partial [Chloroflexi bacterium]|nr:hypothetical protein [Chloroflexota bacterium]